ncbi:hypothetical protein [Microvirga sp. M2]|uniref:hypothetical protein n=1 Tax=Microvirga sp. M2 TaxID=3073270 RepID=UPI0039C0640C
MIQAAVLARLPGCCVGSARVMLDILDQSHRNANGAKRLLRKLNKKQRKAPRMMITDKLASDGAAEHEMMPVSNIVSIVA